MTDMDAALRTAVERLLAQCDKEDRNPDTTRRFLYTSEIRALLGVGHGTDYSGIASEGTS